jgi:ribonucleotide monophosphatase NagD (HAD superfamily)
VGIDASWLLLASFISPHTLVRDEVLFVGNQLDTDIAGGQEYGIRTVWLSGSAYRSSDENTVSPDVRPTHTIQTLPQLPSLLESLHNGK